MAEDLTFRVLPVGDHPAGDELPVIAEIINPGLHPASTAADFR
jgi:hypothetical protein